jgi:hypothetical protein
MDRLMALQAFARVLELDGFPKASDSLQMSKTTVSDLVQCGPRTGRVIDWEFARGGQKVHLTVGGLPALNDHDAYVVDSLMSLGVVKVANDLARPYRESGQLKQVLTD